ncbi:MAG: hypothetical protein KIS30_05730 [Thermoplasmata archaeon]|nr:hypothetical protein [Candidatus Sysuiplasma acidicola]MBX8646240.1 hypothetical protein [Candidatus Sysuiplasma acidicola]MDH2905044.1 SRPBCC domain-containing protein [Methanomassiliicoccales archaeon]
MSQLHYEGNFTVPKKMKQTLALMTDPQRLFNLIPGVERIDILNGKLKVKFRLDLEKMGVTDTGGYLSTVSSVMLFEYSLEGQNLSVRGKGKSAGSSISTDISVILSEYQGGTKLDWKAEVDTGLILKMLGEHRVSTAAGTIISSIIDSFRLTLYSP